MERDNIYYCLRSFVLYWFAIREERQQHCSVWCSGDWYSDLLLLRTRCLERDSSLSPPSIEVRKELHLLGYLAVAIWHLLDRGLVQGHSNLDASRALGWRRHGRTWSYSDGDFLATRIFVLR